MPTFAVLCASARVAAHLLPPKRNPVDRDRTENAPLPSRLRGIHCFGTKFKSRELSTLGRLTSELLRTL